DALPILYGNGFCGVRNFNTEFHFSNFVNSTVSSECRNFPRSEMIKSTTYDSSSSRFSYWSDGDHRKVNTIYDVRSPHARLHKNGSRKRIISRKNHHQTCFTECLDACDYNYGNLVSRYIDRNVCHRTNFCNSWDG